MSSATHLAPSPDELYEAVNIGDVDAVMALLKRGANVNLLSSCGRTVLGRGAHQGHLAIVCLLLDAEKFYSTPEEDDMDADSYFLASDSLRRSSTAMAPQQGTAASCIHPSLSVGACGSRFPPSLSTLKPTLQHKCCSPSIDSETCTCSDELWGRDTSDNAGQHSDLEPPRHGDILPEQLSEEGSDHEPVPCPGSGPPQFGAGNIGYYVYEYREEEEDTGESSGPVLSSTEDSDTAMAERRHLQHPQRHSVLLHRTLGRPSIVSSDSEFETENRRRRRQSHGRHNHRSSHRHERETSRHKGFVQAHPSSPWISQLHSEYLSLGLTSPWSIRRTCDINQQDIYGRSALHYATENGHAYIVHMLIKAGIKVDTPDAEHMTALHLAAQRGLAEVVTLLLDGGSRVNNKMNDKSSPLHIAASRGYTDIVEMLLDRGAKIDSLDGSDRTPLILAVSRMHHKVAQTLIKRGAKVNIEEIHGYTPLCDAVWHKDVKLVSMLLNAGAKVTQSHYLLHYSVQHRQYQLAEMLLGARSIVNLRDDNGDTPLIIAARSCQPSIIKLLLKNGANANYPNGLTGTTPLHEAVEGTRDAHFSEFLGVFRLLRGHGARLDVETVMAGDTPLYRALLLEKNKAASLLIRQGCDVNHITPVSTPDYLHMATLRGQAQLATLLVLSGFSMWKSRWMDTTQMPGVLTVRLASIRSTPLSLNDLCRIQIRSVLGERLESCVEALALPPRLMRFLMLEDLSDVEI